MDAENTYKVLLLAGGGMPDDLKAASGATKCCLIKLGGKTLLERMLDTLNTAMDSPRIAVNLGANAEGAELLPAYGERVSSYLCEGGLLDAIVDGLQLLSADSDGDFQEESVLMVNVDVPLISAPQLTDLVNEAGALGADGVWPVVEKSIILKSFPDTKRTYIPTKQGTFTGGNIFLAKPRLIWENKALLEKAYQNRKSPMGLASIFGLSLVLRFIAGTISIPDLESNFSLRFNAKLRMLPFKHPEVAIDLDKLSDYEMMKNLYGN